MFCVPVPRRTDDRLEIMPRGPTDRPPDQRVVGDQGRGVAFAAWSIFDGKILAYDTLDGRKQFLDGCSVAGSEIQGVAAAVIQEMLDRARMRIGKVENVNEVAHAGPIARVVRIMDLNP